MASASFSDMKVPGPFQLICAVLRMLFGSHLIYERILKIVDDVNIALDILNQAQRIRLRRA